MRRIRAVLFDLDNTLIDFVSAQVGACSAVVSRLGRGNKLDLLDMFVRSRGQYESHAIIADYMAKLGTFDPDLFFECCEAYDCTKNELTKPYEGIAELLAALKGRGIMLGIVTNARRVNAEIRLERTGLKKYFDAIVTADDTERVKPDPHQLLIALGRMGIKPDEALFVGDSIQRDIKAAKKIGMATAYAKYGDCNFFEERDESPDYVLDSPLDLLGIIDGGAVGAHSLGIPPLGAGAQADLIFPSRQTQKLS